MMVGPDMLPGLLDNGCNVYFVVRKANSHIYSELIQDKYFDTQNQGMDWMIDHSSTEPGIVHKVGFLYMHNW